MKTSICFIIFSDGIGGAEQVLAKLADCMAAEGSSPYLITNDELVGYYRSVFPSLKIYNIGKLYTFGSRYTARLINKLDPLISLRCLKIRSKLFAIQTFLRVNAIDVIHSHLMYDLYMASLLKVRNPKLNLVYTVHGFLNLDKSIERRYVFSNSKFMRLLESVDRIVSVSPLISEYISAEYPTLSKRESHIPNGVDIEQVRNASTYKYLAPEGKLNLIFMGGEKGIKGGGLLLDTIDALISSGDSPRFKFTILGPISEGGAFEIRARSLASKVEIDILGFVHAPAHLNYIAAADALVMPSQSEGFPLAVLEAFALGTAVIASDIDVMRHLLPPESLFKRNPLDFLEAIQQLEDSDFLNNLVGYSKNYKVMSWQNVLQKYSELYWPEN